jgi:class 3 adenylate cyclase/pimeloyl-ACP methyl ester carboxylesterase
MRPPPVEYARIGREHVAYQVVGDGPSDGIALTNWAGAVDAVWEHPSHLRIWRSIEHTTRVLQLDHRGVGASDSVPFERLADLDEWVEDLIACMDAAEMPSAGLMAESEQAAVAIAAAARYPERLTRLALVTPRAWFPADPEEGEALVAYIEDVWGSGRLSSRVPGFDETFAGAFERRAAGPGVAAQITRRTLGWDVRHLLAQVRQPVLVMHWRDQGLPANASEALAATLPDATYVETTPTSNWWGDGTFETVVDFVLGGSWRGGERDLATVVFTDIVGSTERMRAVGDDAWRRLLDTLDSLVAMRVARHEGRVVKQTGDGHLLEFARPTDALAAALAIRDGARTLEVPIRTGIHIGNIERRDMGDIGGLAVHVAARIMALAEEDEVLVSRPIADLAGGDGLCFENRGEHALKGVDGAWQLFGASDR